MRFPETGNYFTTIKVEYKKQYQAVFLIVTLTEVKGEFVYNLPGYSHFLGEMARKSEKKLKEYERQVEVDLKNKTGPVWDLIQRVMQAGSESNCQPV